MAKSKQQQLDDAVIAVVDAARNFTEGAATTVSCDYAASGEYTYRVTVPDSPLPVPGLARAPSEADLEASA